MSNKRKAATVGHLGALRVYPARRGKVFFWFLYGSGDLFVGPPPIIVTMFRIAAHDAVFKHRGIAHCIKGAYWWNIQLEVPVSGAPETQAMLQWWGRLCCLWPGADRSVSLSVSRHMLDLLAAAPPPPDLPHESDLTVRAERLRAIDERLFRLAATRQGEVDDLLDEIGELGEGVPPLMYADFARFSKLRGLWYDPQRGGGR